MSRLSTCLIRIINIYGIIFGFCYLYFDEKKRIVKAPKFLKIYAYLINLLHAASTVTVHAHFAIHYPIFYPEQIVLWYAAVVAYIIRICILICLILLRIREEKVLKELFEEFLELHVKYFEHLNYVPVDDTLKIAIIFSTGNIMIHNFFMIAPFIVYLIQNQIWIAILTHWFNDYFYCLLNYTTLHHCIILYYISHCFKKLNSQLRNDKVSQPIAAIYLKMSYLLEKVNDLFGPIMLYSVISLVLTNSLYLYGALLYHESLLHFGRINEIFTFLFICINIYTYFLICERVKYTTKETGRIIFERHMEEKQEELELISMECVLLERDINICGVFSLDLGALFSILAEVVTLTIILMQLEYYLINYVTRAVDFEIHDYNSTEYETE